MYTTSGIQFLCVIVSRQLGCVVDGQDVRERGERDIIHLLFTPRNVPGHMLDTYWWMFWLSGAFSTSLGMSLPFTLHT